MIRWIENFTHYNIKYIIGHPWKFFEACWDEVRWAWQRVFRGWDDRVIWSIDTYLAGTIPVWLKELKKQKHGIPTVCFEDDDWDHEECKFKDGSDEKAEEKYNKILDDIIEGFEIYAESSNFDYLETDENKQKFSKSFDLFKQYFGTFWD